MNMDAVKSICRTIADYRQGEISARTPEDVVRWAGQIDPDFRDDLIEELAHVLDKTYFSKKTILIFLKNLIHNSKLTGGNDSKFWKHAGLMDVQLGGSSQRDMLNEFQKLLKTEVGHSGRIEHENSDTFVYIDDVIFTGNRVRRDLDEWIKKQAPHDAEVHIIVTAIHSGSSWGLQQIRNTIAAEGKRINLHPWCCANIEDKVINESDVLRPRDIAFDDEVEEYANGLEKQVRLRTASTTGKNGFFSSEAARNNIELGLLKAGVAVRKKCHYLAEKRSMRPLGYHYFEMLGFGSTVITYRNCPNNCPLAIWAGDPWHPLFPRSTNSDALMNRIMDSFRPRGSGLG